jgi:nucleotide-binding universal stress UspA family protein
MICHVQAAADDRSRPVLLCFDGSDRAASAIAQAGGVLGVSAAVVLTVWEPVAVWEPYDPGALLDVGVGKLAGHALGLDEIARDLAAEKADQGVTLARQAGFVVEARIARGKTWKTICDVADDIDAAVIVLGARGLSPVGSALLGSVSSAVAVHAGRPVLVIPRPRS